MVYTDGNGAFDWDEANVEHIARHGVSPGEAEEVLLSPERVLLAMRHVHGEPRRALIGQTESGRLLIVMYTVRNGLIRIITARPPSAQERRTFQRHRRRQL